MKIYVVFDTAFKFDDNTAGARTIMAHAVLLLLLCFAVVAFKEWCIIILNLLE